MVSMAIAGVGMVMVSLTRRLSMTMSRAPLFFTVISSASVLEFPSERTEETVKLDKRLKDEFQLFQFVCFFFLPLLV